MTFQTLVKIFKYMIEFMINTIIIKGKKMINSPKIIMDKLFNTIVI
jgi:hypothetical protein